MTVQSWMKKVILILDQEAKNFDLKKANEMFRKSLTWRAEMGADSILKDFSPPEVIRMYYPGGIFGEDREGHPVWIDPLGNTDVKGILQSVKKSDVIRSMVYKVEFLKTQFIIASKKHGRPIDQCLHVVDISGVGSNFLWKPAPKVFRAAFAVFKKFIDEGTANKFVMLDDNWQAELQKDIDGSQLPVYFGGSQCDSDGNPKCLSRLCYGGLVPESYYKKQKGFDCAEGPLCHETVGRYSKYEVRKEVKHKNTLLTWLFATDSGAVFFSVYHENAIGDNRACNREVMVERTEVQCHLVPEDGSLTCDKSGIYCLVFENCSLLSTRNLTYTVQVEETGVHSPQTPQKLSASRLI